MARYSARLRIEHTRVMDAPIAQVYEQVADLCRWSEWSPWLAAQNDARLTFSERADQAGSHCTWSSPRSGEGTVEHLRLRPLERIEQRVRCQQPFAFGGTIRWTFTQRAGQTEVRWVLRGRVNFALRFVAQTVKATLALDYRYAMDRLAALVEPPAAPRYVITHLGLREIGPERYVHTSYRGPLQGLGNARQKGLSELRRELAKQTIEPCGAPLSVYLTTNTRLRTTQCHIGIPVDAPTPLPTRDMPAQRAYVVRLQGSHAALDIAWYLAMQGMMAANILPDQRLPPFERYLVDSGTASDGNNVTELHIPVR
jgi:uncharacterized protein YndB with AHSA1/START domain